MKRNKKLPLLLLTAISCAAAVLVVTTNKGWASEASSEHVHGGNHYSMLAPTDTEAGTHEYWVCCECSEHFLTAPATGIWTDKGTAPVISDPSDDRYLAPGLGEYIDKTAGWTTTYDAEKGYFVYTNTTNGAARIYKDLTVTHNSLLSFKLKVTGLENNFNWATGLFIAEDTSVNINNGSLMIFGKSSATTKYLTSAIRNGAATSWNAPKGANTDKIALVDGTEYDISMSFDFESGIITTFTSGVTSIFAMSANLKTAGKGYVGLFGATMQTGKTYGEVVVSDLKVNKSYGTAFDNQEGVSETVDGNDVKATNTMDFGTRVYANKVINKSVSATGTISFTYRTNGLEYDASAKKARSNWCAGLMFATTTTAKFSDGKFVVFGKTSGAPRRIASLKSDSTLASGKQAWNLAKTGSADIIVNENEEINLTIDYDFTNKTFVVSDGVNVSTFPMPDFLANAGKAYIGLYGSNMTASYTYGEVSISNLVVKTF